MVRSTVLSIILSFLALPLFAQSFRFQPHRFGDDLFAGGIDTPRYQFVDIDGDHDADLFVLDRDERLWFYRNVNGSFRLEPDVTFGLTVGSWFHFADIDADGDLDCFTNGSSSEVSLFTNTGSATAPQFTLTSSALKDSSGLEMFSERFSIPTLADPDGDGDLDFFTGSSIGSVTYYKNIGTKKAPAFTYITGAYQGINIQGAPRPFPKPMHGASGIEFFDADSNGVLDLFWGDYFNPSLYYLHNYGTAVAPNIVLVDSTYPNEAVVSTFGFNVPQHVDLDGNSTTDLVIGSVFPNMDKDNFQWFSNEGTNAAPFYVLKTKNIVPMIDVGTRSSVAIADVDHDGDADLIVAAGALTVNVFLNSGSAFVPKFSVTPDAVLTLPGQYNLCVTTADLNHDSLPDLIIGTYENGLRTYINTTTDGVVSFAHTSHPLESFVLGQSAAPCAADIDHDGKTDLLVGTSGGTIWYLHNTGTAGTPSYSATANFNAIDVGNDAVPAVADLDHDGRWELYIGNVDGIIRFYAQSAVNAEQFSLLSSQFQGIDIRISAAPAFADIDGDGDEDLFLGNGKGGIFYFENSPSLSAGPTGSIIPASVALLPNYPNPFNPSTRITFRIAEPSDVFLDIIDPLGRLVEKLYHGTMQPGQSALDWNGSGRPSGIYWCRLSVRSSHGTTVQTRKMVLIH